MLLSFFQPCKYIDIETRISNVNQKILNHKVANNIFYTDHPKPLYWY